MKENSIVVERGDMRVELSVGDQGIEQVGVMLRAALIGLTFHPDTVVKILPLGTE